MTNATLNVKSYVRDSHVRIDEGDGAKSRRSSLYNMNAYWTIRKWVFAASMVMSLTMLGEMRRVAVSWAPIEDFWKENVGRTIERLPNAVLPEIAFLCLGGKDVEPTPGYYKIQDVVRNAVCGISPFNTVTLTLRRAGELTDPAVMRETAAIVTNAHAHGVLVSMDIDHRIARTEFFRRWPGEAQQELDWGMFRPSNDGVASFRIEPEYRGDHMTGGKPGNLDYTARKAELAAAFAAKTNAAGEVVSSSVRAVDVSLDGTAPAGTLAGTAKGLAANEVLLVCAKETLHFVDLFSPHLMPWQEELALRYKAIGVDCAMHDEWGFPGIGGSDADRMTRHLACWYSPGSFREEDSAVDSSACRWSDDFEFKVSPKGETQ